MRMIIKQEDRMSSLRHCTESQKIRKCPPCYDQIANGAQKSKCYYIKLQWQLLFSSTLTPITGGRHVILKCTYIERPYIFRPSRVLCSTRRVHGACTSVCSSCHVHGASLGSLDPSCAFPLTPSPWASLLLSAMEHDHSPLPH